MFITVQYKPAALVKIIDIQRKKWHSQCYNNRSPDANIRQCFEMPSVSYSIIFLQNTNHPFEVFHYSGRFELSK